MRFQLLSSCLYLLSSKSSFLTTVVFFLVNLTDSVFPQVRWVCQTSWSVRLFVFRPGLELFNTTRKWNRMYLIKEELCLSNEKVLTAAHSKMTCRCQRHLCDPLIDSPQNSRHQSTLRASEGESDYGNLATEQDASHKYRLLIQKLARCRQKRHTGSLARMLQQRYQQITSRQIEHRYC
jgi:hypothetical protein